MPFPKQANTQNITALLSMVALRGVAILASYVVTLMIVQLFEPSDAGNYFYTFAYIGIAASIASCGVNMSIVRFFGETNGDHHANRIFSIAHGWVLLSATVVCLITWLFAEHVATEYLNKPAIAQIAIAQTPAILGLTLASMFAHAFQGLRKPVLTFIFLGLASNIIYAASLLICLSLSLDGLSVIDASWLLSGSCLLIALSAYYVWWRHVKQSIKPLFKKSADLASSAGPLWLVLVIGVILKQGSLMIAGINVSSAEVAQLSVAVKASEIMSVVFLAVTMISSPVYARLWAQNNKNQLVKELKSNLIILFVIGLVMCAFMSIFSRQILGLFGEFYSGNKQLLIILSVGQFCYLMLASSITLLNMTKHENELALCYLVTAVITLPLTWWLVTNYAVIGAAYATSISLFILGLTTSLTAWRRLAYTPS